MVNWTTVSVRDYITNEDANAPVITDADFAEIEAFANSREAVSV